MEFVYLFLRGSEWEDIIVFLSEDDAIKESINYPNHRVEIFCKTDKSGYKPTYNHYKNGVLIENNKM
jgi:hypothetical protein